MEDTDDFADVDLHNLSASHGKVVLDPPNKRFVSQTIGMLRDGREWLGSGRVVRSVTGAC